MKGVFSMKKFSIYIIVFIVTMLLFTGCTSLETINNKAVKNLRKDLMGITSSIKTVNVTTWGPSAKIDVYFTDKPPQEITDAVFEKVKAFSTEDNLKSFVMRYMVLSLAFYINGDKENPSIIYHTSYYNSNDMTDDSPSNINGYKTWTIWTSSLD
jgi:hypothetical protein